MTIIANASIAEELQPFIHTSEKDGRFWIHWSSRPETWSPHKQSVGAQAYHDLRKRGLAGRVSTNNPDHVDRILHETIARVQQLARKVLAMPPAQTKAQDIRAQLVSALDLEPIDEVAPNARNGARVAARKTSSGVQPLGAVSELDFSNNISVARSGDVHRAVLQVTVTRSFLSQDEAQHWAHMVAAQIASAIAGNGHAHARTGS